MDTYAAKSELLINVPRSKAFNAFFDKQIICKFWLAHSTGDLTSGAKVEWTFMVPGAKETVDVLELQSDEFIKFKWSDGKVVDIIFKSRSEHSTRILITASQFTDVAQVINATEGFAIVLCDLKCFLETGISGSMVRDKALIITDEIYDTNEALHLDEIDS